ncbi:MAG: hypothetical protein ABI168_09645 [Ginsengibacter sp.]
MIIPIKVNYSKTQIFRFLFLFLITLTFTNSYAQWPASTAKDRLSAEVKRTAIQSSSFFNNVTFRNIGPSVMSGRVVDVDVNPSDPTEFYVAYATGGLWYTANNGQSLIPVFDSASVIGIGDIAVDWNKNIIWVGTGEANSSRSSYAGIGVFKSMDKGRTWTYMGLPESHHIGKILLDPNDDNVAWVAASGHLYSPNKERGVYKTTDGGKTWKQTLYIDENTSAIDMDLNPKNPLEVYACMWHRERRAWDFKESGPTSAIYKSNDGGNTWKKITGGNSGFPDGANIGRTGIAVFAGNPQILYADVDNNNHRPDTAKTKIDTSRYVLNNFKDLTKEKFLELDAKKLDAFLKKSFVPEKYRDSLIKQMVRNGQVKPTIIYDYLSDANSELFNTPIIGCEVYRSDDGGTTWKKTNKKGLDLYNTYGYYFAKIAVSAVNEKKVVIGGFTLMASNDGGANFKAVDKPNTHPDWHAIWINPARDSNWVTGNDGGCNITYDNGNHWFKVNTPAVAQFYAIAVDSAKPYNVYGGIQDNGVWYGSSKSFTNDIDPETPNNWKNLGGGDGMQVQIDTRDNKTVYFGSQFGYYQKKIIGEKEKYNSIHPLAALEAEKLRFNWQTPILLSSFNQDILYMGTNMLYRSMNKGETMLPLGKDLTKGKKAGNVPYGTIVTLSESPLYFGLIYAGTDDGNIQMSKDGGNTWSLISRDLPKDLYVSRVIASAYVEGRVYATLNGYRFDNFTPWVYMSNDFGKTWKQLGSNLPMEPVNVIREDPYYENILYLGTDNGLYVSINKGESFMSLGKLPPVPVHDIAIQKGAKEIVVGTHGRSIYIASLKEIYDKNESAKK